MTESQAMSEHGRAERGHVDYVKVWAILVLLLVLSVAGPAAGMWWLTLLTAFGIAVVKAWMVAAYFMHLRVEPRYVSYLLVALVALVVVLFAGVAPDVMKERGQNWQHKRVAARPAAAPPAGH
jgi:caa(3)-type oxidase subunit IV